MYIYIYMYMCFLSAIWPIWTSWFVGFRKYIERLYYPTRMVIKPEKWRGTCLLCISTNHLLQICRIPSIPQKLAKNWWQNPTVHQIFWGIPDLLRNRTCQRLDPHLQCITTSSRAVDRLPLREKVPTCQQHPPASTGRKSHQRCMLFFFPNETRRHGVTEKNTLQKNWVLTG